MAGNKAAASRPPGQGGGQGVTACGGQTGTLGGRGPMYQGNARHSGGVTRPRWRAYGRPDAGNAMVTAVHAGHHMVTCALPSPSIWGAWVGVERFGPEGLYAASPQPPAWPSQPPNGLTARPQPMLPVVPSGSAQRHVVRPTAVERA